MTAKTTSFLGCLCIFLTALGGYALIYLGTMPRSSGAPSFQWATCVTMVFLIVAAVLLFILADDIAKDERTAQEVRLQRTRTGLQAAKWDLNTPLPDTIMQHQDSSTLIVLPAEIVAAANYLNKGLGDREIQTQLDDYIVRKIRTEVEASAF